MISWQVYEPGTNENQLTLVDGDVTAEDTTQLAFHWDGTVDIIEVPMHITGFHEWVGHVNSAGVMGPLYFRNYLVAPNTTKDIAERARHLSIKLYVDASMATRHSTS